MDESQNPSPAHSELLAWLKRQTPDAEREASDDEAVGTYLNSGRRRQPTDELVTLLLPPTRRPTREVWQTARLNAQRWDGLGLATAVVRAWLVAGLHPEESDVAHALISEGITPDYSARVFADPETAERLSILEFVRRHLPDPYKPLSRWLDEAGVERTPSPHPLKWRWTS